MSVNYHAYQCRDYLLSDYEEICLQWQKAFENYDPERVCRILNLDSDETYVYVNYLHTLFRIHLKTGWIEKQLNQEETIADLVRNAFRKSLSHAENRIKQQSLFREIVEILQNPTQGKQNLPKGSSYLKLNDRDATDPGTLAARCRKIMEEENGWTDQVYFNEGMAVYHLLSYVKDSPHLSGQWIPNTNLDPRTGKGNPKEELLFTEFADLFADHTELLHLACRENHGTEISSKADLAYQFEVFPQVSVQLQFYDRDEEFPAQAQIFVDRRITDYVHIETTGCMVSDLFEKLIYSAFVKKEKSICN